MFQASQIGGNLTASPDYFQFPWTVAPAKLKAAFDAANEAKIAAYEAVANEQEAEINAVEATQKWDTEALELVRADKPLPSRDETDRANLKLIAAKQDVHAAEMNQLSKESELGALLDDVNLRDEWAENMEAQLKKDQKSLGEKATAVIELTNRIQQMSSFSTFLAVFPSYGAPEVKQANFVAQTIDSAINAKLQKRPTPEAKYGGN